MDAKPTMLSHLNDKGTYVTFLGVATTVVQEMNLDVILKVAVALCTLVVLIYTILEKRQKIRLTKLQIQAEIKVHHITEEDE